MKKLNAEKGFTLIELLVAMSLFTVILSIAVGAFINSLRTQRQVNALMSANSNAALAIEQISREIRLGKNFCPDETLCQITPDGAFQKLIFTSGGKTLTYYRGGNQNRGFIAKEENNGEPVALTSNNANVKKLNFYLLGHRAGTPETPRVTIVLQIGTAEKSFAAETLNFQTTVSSRATK